MNIQPIKNFIDSTGKGAIDLCSKAAKGTKKAYTTAKDFTKNQADKFVNTNAVKSTKKFLGNNKETIVGVGVLVGVVALTTGCIKTIVDKVNEVRNRK